MKLLYLGLMLIVELMYLGFKLSLKLLYLCSKFIYLCRQFAVLFSDHHLFVLKFCNLLSEILDLSNVKVILTLKSIELIQELIVIALRLGLFVLKDFKIALQLLFARLE